MDIIPVGVDLRRFSPLPRREARRRLGLPADERFLLFPADPARPEKRVTLAQSLADALPGVALHTYHRTPSEQVPLWIAAADAVVITSEREGYGLGCMEALACDVPVLSTPVGVASEVLGRVSGTLCAPFNLARWRSHAEQLLTDPDPHVKGRAVAAEQSTDAMALRTLALYREVLRRAAPS
jgi:glycosyltransferase involved in cell wall biosynthesis